MIVNFDHFNKCENPILTICNPNNKTLSVIANYTDLELEPNFSAISTVKLTVYKYIKDKVSDSENNKNREADCWKYIAECRQIHVENIGYFPIVSVTINDNKDNPSCEIEADSCESEWNNHGIALPAGVYQFYDATKPNDTILGKILNLCPTWNIGYISPTVANTFRTFDDLEKSVYQFLMEDCTNAYECFIVPDIQNRTISVYSSHDEIPNTDILLTYDNVLKNCKIERLAENIYTALKVTGGEDSSSSDNSELSIISANPLGTDTIYKFNYFMKPEWMTQGLIDAINAWNKKIADSQTNYNTIISNISNAESEYATIDGQLSNAQATLDGYKDDMNAIQSTDQTAYNQLKAQCDAQQVVVSNIKSQLDAKQTIIDGYKAQLTALQNSLSMESNLTHEQILELTPYIKQTTYKDENITVTDTMTWAERYAQIQTLYTRGVNKLAELSQPTYIITIECVNFAFIKEFEHFRSQFNLGNMIHVENDPQGDILNFLVLSYNIKYNSYDLEIKLSNKLKLHDAYSKTQDLYSNLTASASTLSVNKNSWNYPVKSGTINNLKEFMDKPLNLSTHELIAKDDQSPLVDKYGFHGRKINADGTVDPEQLDIRNNEILFTNDNWKTPKCAIGKMQLPDGSYVYGINLDAVVAGKIYANMLKLGGSGTNGNMVLDDASNNAMILFSNQGITLQNGAKLIGTNGLLSEFMFGNGNLQPIGINERFVGTTQAFYGVRVLLDYYIPDNFVITEAYVHLMLYPNHYENVVYYDSGGQIYHATDWGNPKNIVVKKAINTKCILPKIQNYGEIADLTTYPYESANYADITQTVFNVSSMTPTYDVSWNPESVTTNFGTEYVSGNIVNLLQSGYGELMFVPSTIPSFTPNVDLVTIAQNSGMAVAFLTVVGYKG